MQDQTITEIVSALADGQLHGDEFAHAVELVSANGDAREAWHTYHLIGDVLRSGDFAAGTIPTAFMSRLQARLQQEQAIAPVVVEAAAPALDTGREAANDASFRWKLVAGFASLAAVAAIGWGVVGIQATTSTQPQLAVAQPPAGAVLAGNNSGVMLRDPRLDEFMAAHRQLGGATALQMPAGFIRNATFEGVSR
ncbi:MAG: sigma-E factor negative regulatory protein [Ramlibacter sp.]|nr:sigma-E factor negative regulatory protein [Ramlibacter sp.]